MYAVPMATKLLPRRGLLTPTPWVIALVQLLLLTALAAPAQTAPAAANYPTVSAAEVTAFMQSLQIDPNAMSRISSNPKRVPLLLGAMKRDPAGPWAGFLQGFCFQEGRAAAFKLPPAGRAEVSARAVVYLTAAKTTLTKALETDSRNGQLNYNLSMIDKALALARTESVARTNDSRGAASPRPATNTLPRVESTVPGENPAPALRAKACGSNLTQIDLAKQMWQVDNNKPETATPTVADLSYYLPYRQFPKCPEGGTYVIGKLNQKPTCSVAGHELPKRTQ